ncbi:SWI/SNF complex subunit SWI3B-like isoform X4 [Durio zibethinus]|uniref:SWI/SNF complex subunit SWI3B-like isoform X4 n=1 Tax=Durio zibethinus TaxID=66656 RepID=A0A6P6B5T6_DURZI|nr:SWI/SNF complex subunit SWI3B-like isoform X4 [Durio zibethinus]
MAGKSPVKAAASSDTTSTPIPNPNQFKPPQISTKLTTPAAVKSEIPSTPTRSSRPSSIDADVIHVPSYSRWFSWGKIDSCELRFLPEFFDGRYPSKSPILYMYYRNSIIKQFRENPSRKIFFTDARRTLLGDVGSVRRVFDFLELWGLINYSASSTHLKDAALTSKHSSTCGRFCGACRSLCTFACFVHDKAAFLSALAGVKVAEAATLAALTTLSEVDDTRASKVGRGSLLRNTRQEADISSDGDTNLNALERAYADLDSLLEKEEQDIERAINGITEVQMKEIQDRILHFEELYLQMEKERQKFEGMKNLLFIYQLNLSFGKSYAMKTEERVMEKVKTDFIIIVCILFYLPLQAMANREFLEFKEIACQCF